MKQLPLIALATSALLFLGCSSKQYFKPKVVSSASFASKVFEGDLVDLSRDGGTMANEYYLGKTGINSIALGKGYRFLNENNHYTLAGNKQGILRIFNKKTGKLERAVSLHAPIMSASINNGVIAYVLDSNIFGVYEMKTNRKIIENRSERTFAIDTRVANPMFVDNLIVIPMLDGKLIIVDAKNTRNVKMVYISSEVAFNNVIFLSRLNNTMVAATPSMLIALGDSGKIDYKANISEVTIGKKSIYVFSKEGKILALDKKLHLLSSTSFKFAHYVAATVLEKKVYVLDQQGSLIVLNDTLTKFKIYDVGTIDKPAFITGTKLYIDGKVVELSKLGYE